jgi:hypothetical protein
LKYAALGLFVSLMVGCQASKPMTVELTGTPGAIVNGYYVAGGKRVAIDGKLPITLNKQGITLLAVRKQNASDTLSAQARGSDGMISMSSAAGKAGGIRLELGDGYSGSNLEPDESLDVPVRDTLTIQPYWDGHTWVFDDAAVGLEKEPFVEGIPKMIDVLVKDIPGAREGFRLTFSPKKFDGAEMKLDWVRAEGGGNVYRLARPRMEGWLCPALFRYFDHAPKQLYLRADPKS